MHWTGSLQAWPRCRHQVTLGRETEGRWAAWWGKGGQSSLCCTSLQAWPRYHHQVIRGGGGGGKGGGVHGGKEVGNFCGVLDWLIAGLAKMSSSGNWGGGGGGAAWCGEGGWSSLWCTRLAHRRLGQDMIIRYWLLSPSHQEHVLRSVGLAHWLATSQCEGHTHGICMSHALGIVHGPLEGSSEE